MKKSNQKLMTVVVMLALTFTMSTLALAGGIITLSESKGWNPYGTRDGNPKFGDYQLNPDGGVIYRCTGFNSDKSPQWTPIATTAEAQKAADALHLGPIGTSTPESYKNLQAATDLVLVAKIFQSASKGNLDSATAGYLKHVAERIPGTTVNINLLKGSPYLNGLAEVVKVDLNKHVSRLIGTQAKDSSSQPLKVTSIPGLDHKRWIFTPAAQGRSAATVTRIPANQVPVIKAALPEPIPNPASHPQVKPAPYAAYSVMSASQNAPRPTMVAQPASRIAAPVVQAIPRVAAR